MLLAQPVHQAAYGNLLTFRTGEYLDQVYGAHDQGMLFVGIMWIVFGGLILFYGIGRRLIPSRSPSTKSNEATSAATSQPFLYRLSSALSATLRRYLLPESFRRVFGRIARLQVLVLVSLAIYLTIFTFAGYKYATWVTPVKNMEGVYNTRTSLGPFSDRIGVLAYALIPLSVFLANRESLLSLLTGIPYQHFQFLHRWLGYIILVQSAVHTIGWTVVEARLYQPQPKVWNNFIKQTYMIWGVVAMVLIILIYVMSLPCTIRRTGYELFRKVHYVFAAIFMGACYAHWANLGCFLIASLAVWGLDRIVRLLRTFLLHYQYLPESTEGMRFQSAKAKIRLFEDDINGDVVRLDFSHKHAAWQVGQHFYLCFPESSIWQSHPFTPASLPGAGLQGQQHTYVFRAKGGETRKMAEIAREKLATMTASATNKAVEAGSTSMLPAALQPQPRSSMPTASVILQGPYGTGHVDALRQSPDMNVLLVAGGTGITFVLPVLFHLMSAPTLVESAFHKDRKVELIWAVRRRADVRWVERELDTLRAPSKRMNLAIRIFVTREDGVDDIDAAKAKQEARYGADEKKDLVARVQEQAKTTASSSSTSSDTGGRDEIRKDESESTASSTAPRRFSIQHTSRRHADMLKPDTQHPDLARLVRDFVDTSVRGPTTVYASGPGGMITDLREVVAQCNDGARVWTGDERWSVDLVCDDRMEWY